MKFYRLRVGITNLVYDFFKQKTFCCEKTVFGLHLDIDLRLTFILSRDFMYACHIWQEDDYETEHYVFCWQLHLIMRMDAHSSRF